MFEEAAHVPGLLHFMIKSTGFVSQSVGGCTVDRNEKKQNKCGSGRGKAEHIIEIYKQELQNDNLLLFNNWQLQRVIGHGWTETGQSSATHNVVTMKCEEDYHDCCCGM